MITEENINKIYEEIINKNELTTKELNSYGLNSKDITILINDGTLERIKRGYYTIINKWELYNYGKKMLKEKNFDSATKYFEKSYELDPTNTDVCFRLLKQNVLSGKFEKALQYLETLYATENPYYISDNNFYLYLFDYFMDIPENLKNHVKNLEFKDIRVDYSDPRYKNVKKINKIRLSAFNNNFSLAIKQLKEMIEEENYVSAQSTVIKRLLHEAQGVSYNKKIKIRELLKNENYETVLQMLSEEEQKGRLSEKYIYIKLLINDLLEINKTKIIPKIKQVEVNNVFDAINARNYELALKINNTRDPENEFKLLLTTICNEINQIKEQENKSKQTKCLSNTQKETRSLTFTDVISSLLKQDIEQSFIVLDEYMNSINKTEFKLLIMNLIKLSLLENDFSFTKPIVTLTHISRGEFKCDLTDYIQEFYIMLSKNNFKEAHIYLDIISDLNKYTNDENTVIILEQILQMKELQVNTALKEDKTIDSSLIIEKTNLETADTNLPESTMEIQPEVEELITEEQEYLQKTKFNTSKRTEEPKKIDNEKYIEKQYQKLQKNKGIILLPPMDSERRYKIHEIVAKYENMVSFNIGEGNKRQIVLKYKSTENLDLKELHALAKEQYSNKEYNECIETYLQILSRKGDIPYIYGRIGLAFCKINDKKSAIPYLKVATELNKENNIDIDYSDLIMQLQLDVPDIDRKKRFKMLESEFQDDTNENYGIDNIKEITEYILSSKLDVETACINLGMNEEQINIIKLIYAREYYCQEFYEKGDEFIKSVEKSNGKNKKIMKLQNEIIKNKNLYKNRQREEELQLVLTLKPKK